MYQLYLSQFKYGRILVIWCVINNVIPNYFYYIYARTVIAFLPQMSYFKIHKLHKYIGTYTN